MYREGSNAYPSWIAMRDQNLRSKNAPSRPETALNQAAYSALEEFHPRGDVRLRGLDEEMEVVAHQAVRVAAPLVTADGRVQLGEKRLAIARNAVEERALPDSP